jgi:hypothetical protein
MSNRFASNRSRASRLGALFGTRLVSLLGNVIPLGLFGEALPLAGKL